MNTHVLCHMAKARKHFDFDEIEEYLRNKTYPFYNKNGKLEVTFLLVDRQTDGFNFGLFALVCASILLDGKYLR